MGEWVNGQLANWLNGQLVSWSNIGELERMERQMGNVDFGMRNSELKKRSDK
jgi:hypothetical protein